MYKVRKRTGKLIEFDLAKISNAITLAFDACEKQYNQNIIDFLALKEVYYVLVVLLFACVKCSTTRT